MQSKYTLLQCASPDAIARLPATELKHDAEKLWREYFINQKHGSLKDYLVHCLGNVNDTEYDGSLVQVSFALYHIVVIHVKFWMILVSSVHNSVHNRYSNQYISNAYEQLFFRQITTHSRLLSKANSRAIASAAGFTGSQFCCISLQEFHTEQQFLKALE